MLQVVLCGPTVLSKINAGHIKEKKQKLENLRNNRIIIAGLVSAKTEEKELLNVIRDSNMV